MATALPGSTQKTLTSCKGRARKGKRLNLDPVSKPAKDEPKEANLEKIEKRRAQKRTHARKKRNKEKEQRQLLEAKYNRLKDENNKLKMETGQLKLYTSVLKGIVEHIDVACSHQSVSQTAPADVGQKTLDLPAEASSSASCQSQVPEEMTSLTSSRIQSSAPALSQERPSTSGSKAAHNTMATVRAAPPSPVFRQKTNYDLLLDTFNMAPEDDEDDDEDIGDLFAALPPVSFDYESNLLEDLVSEFASADCSSMRLTVFPEDGGTGTS